MENNAIRKSFILGLCLVIGLTVLGLFIYRGLKTFSDKDRVVTVKGLAEMKIDATAATITLDFSFSGDELPEILKETKSKKDAILAYLSEIGYQSNQITIKNVDIIDRQKYYDTEWQDGKQVKTKVNRYTASQSMVIQSTDIKGTEDKAAEIKLDLVSKELTSNITTAYVFPELNAIKPKLIAESTKNARVAGEQFANDSQASLGKIKTASQGQISIAGDYQYNEEGGADNQTPDEPYIQKVRVVSTIVFFLE